MMNTIKLLSNWVFNKNNCLILFIVSNIIKYDALEYWTMKSKWPPKGEDRDSISIIYDVVNSYKSNLCTDSRISSNTYRLLYIWIAAIRKKKCYYNEEGNKRLLN